MLRRAPLLPLLALALAIPPLGGCSPKPKLTTVAVPEAGVTMRYDLTPGQEYKGRVRMRNAVQTPVGEVLTVLQFDVVMVVTDNDKDGGKLVRATVNAIDLNLRLPDGIPAAAAGGITPEAAAALNGTELRFRLDDHGEVSDEPEVPENAPMELKAILGMLTSSLTSAFVRVPDQAVKDGGSWDAASKKPKDGVKSSSSTGTLAGLGRNEAGDELAELGYVSEMEATRQGQDVKVKQKVKASFSTTGGYPVQIKRDINNEVVGQGTLLTEIEASWTKGTKHAVEGGANPGEDVQTITDPCDPDYVGADECKTDPAADAPK